MRPITETAEGVPQIESVLADMLDSYADLRERYIHADPTDYHSLAGPDRIIANEVSGIRQAAYIVRNHRDDTAGAGLPSRLWGQWAAVAQETSRRLGEFLVSVEARGDDTLTTTEQAPQRSA